MEKKVEPEVGQPLGNNLAHCGVPTSGSRRKRLVGGSEITPLEYPWTVAIGYKGQLIGGGVLISDRFVLTSARNIQARTNGGSVDSLIILAGVHDLTRNEATKKVVRVSKVHYHPNLGDKHNHNYDFALLELRDSVQFRPVCLPWTQMPLYVGQGMYLTGWGRTSPRSAGSTVLLKATLNLQSKSQCNPVYSNALTPQMMCAAGSGKNACLGDEGAPLVIPKEGRLYLAGITSFGLANGCPAEGRATIFADVRWALPWIATTTGLNV
ncbi:Transmembrane protease serine 6 [Halotydeus destructor]|nr:Transmembrane protease serine 6 [Halotydeus destructor]